MSFFQNKVKNKNVLIFLYTDYISYMYEENSKMIYEEIKDNTLNNILERFDKQSVNFSIIASPQSMFIKNREKENKLEDELISKNVKYKEIELNSFLIINKNLIKNLLLKYKSYHIEYIYDYSILSSEIFIKNIHDLYVNISNDFITIIHKTDFFQKRVISISFENLIREIERKTTLTRDNTIEFLEKEFTNIKEFKESGNIETEKIRVILILDYIHKIVNQIELSIDLFNEKVNFNYIDRIFISGNIIEYKNLINFIKERLKDLDVKVKPFDSQNYFDLFFKDDKNIKKYGIETQKYTYEDNNIKYIYNKGEFKDINSLTKNKKVKITKNKRDEGLKQENKKIIFLFFVILIVISWNMYESILNNYKYIDRNLKKFIEITNSNEIKINKNINMNVKEINKVFWSEKLFNIFNEIKNEKIWFDSITLKNIKTQKILIAKGKVPIEKQEYMKSIVLYINRIEHLKDMKTKDGLSKIIFKGAKIIQSKEAEFELNFIFEKEKI